MHTCVCRRVYVSRPHLPFRYVHAYQTFIVAVSDTDGSFLCTCLVGFSGNGVQCSNVDECALNLSTCGPLATCNDTYGSFTCDCGQTGFDSKSINGLDCLDTNECASKTHSCSQLAACNNTQGSFSCSCNNGYNGTGVTCSDVDECASGLSTCHAAAGVCVNVEGSFSCSCQSGFTGNGVVCEAEDSMPVLVSPTQCTTLGG
jgi:hypothetical protein